MIELQDYISSVFSYFSIFYKFWVLNIFFTFEIRKISLADFFVAVLLLRLFVSELHTHLGNDIENEEAVQEIVSDLILSPMMAESTQLYPTASYCTKRQGPKLQQHQEPHLEEMLCFCLPPFCLINISLANFSDIFAHWMEKTSKLKTTRNLLTSRKRKMF